MAANRLGEREGGGRKGREGDGGRAAKDDDQWRSLSPVIGVHVGERNLSGEDMR